MATRRLEDLPKDLDTQISVDFNELLRKVHFGLSNNLKKKTDTMPVWTGFLLLAGKYKHQPLFQRIKQKILGPGLLLKRT